jgi:hypothetical protein
MRAPRRAHARGADRSGMTSSLAPAPSGRKANRIRAESSAGALTIRTRDARYISASDVRLSYPPAERSCASHAAGAQWKDGRNERPAGTDEGCWFHEDREVSRHLPTGDRTAPSRRIQQRRHWPRFRSITSISAGGSSALLSAESESRGHTAAPHPLSPRRSGARCCRSLARHPGAAARVVLHARCCVVVRHGPTLVSNYRPYWIDFSLDRVTRHLLRVKCLLLRDKCRPTPVKSCKRSVGRPGSGLGCVRPAGGPARRGRGGRARRRGTRRGCGLAGGRWCALRAAARSGSRPGEIGCRGRVCGR